MKSQFSMSNGRFFIEIWDLGFHWDLGFGHWDLIQRRFLETYRDTRSTND
jgi:hypothetical protein